MVFEVPSKFIHRTSKSNTSEKLKISPKNFPQQVVVQVVVQILIDRKYTVFKIQNYYKII